jgi:mono/diheme cytochrome c family protein
MSTRNSMGLVGLAALVCACSTLAQPSAGTPQSPHLGVPATPEQIAGWDISIPPDGAGLPPGSGTAAQGAALYQSQCFACHGERGQGLVNDRLAGGHGSLATSAAVKTVGSYWPYATTIFDFVRRAMPYQAPHSLTNDQAYALTAYLLYVNGIIEENRVIDAESLPRVEMPNRNGFVRVAPYADER